MHLIVSQSQFDLRAHVYPTELYKETLAPSLEHPKAQVHILLLGSREGSHKWIYLLEKAINRRLDLHRI